MGSDCQSDVCSSFICQQAACPDGVANGTETGTDCGGPNSCARCAEGLPCAQGSDCEELVCGNDDLCAAPSCSPGDGQRNGLETGTDCGGAGCPTCANGENCSVAGDCTSGFCNSQDQCSDADCNDGAMNGDETDINCGGPDCNQCENGDNCLIDTDCTSGRCDLNHSNLECQAATMVGKTRAKARSTAAVPTLVIVVSMAAIATTAQTASRIAFATAAPAAIRSRVKGKAGNAATWTPVAVNRNSIAVPAVARARQARARSIARPWTIMVEAPPLNTTDTASCSKTTAPPGTLARAGAATEEPVGIWP